MEDHKKKRALEHDNVEKQLSQYAVKNQMIDSELQYPLPVCSRIKLFSGHGVGHKQIQENSQTW